MIKIMIIATMLVASVEILKLQSAYIVTLNGQEVGYVYNKEKFQKVIQEQILTPDSENIAFVTLDNVEYKFAIIEKNKINEETTFSTLKEESNKVYRVYEVADNNSDNKIYVNTINEAENLVNSLKEEYSEIEPDLKITTLYLDSEASDIEEEKEKMTENLDSKLEEKQEIDSKSVNGVYLACVPVTGNITSRFGSRESIRSHNHKGLDIAAAYGSSIKAAADGTVISAGWNDGGYGNLVIIDHGNGITTYYGHCSKVYVSAGQKVSAGDIIAAVGSTGNSTGNHLHFEVRVDDVQVDPQNYIYK